MTAEPDRVRAHLRDHFHAAGIAAEPDAASVTFLGSQPVEVLRFGPGPDGVLHYVSLGCSRHPMADPTAMVADPLLGPRAEVVLSLRSSGEVMGLARMTQPIQDRAPASGNRAPLTSHMGMSTTFMMAWNPATDSERQAKKNPTEARKNAETARTAAAWRRPVRTG